MISVHLISQLQTSAQKLRVAVKKKSKIKTELLLDRVKGLVSIAVEDLGDFESESLQNLNRHLHFIEHYTKKGDFDSCSKDADDIVESDLPAFISELTKTKQVSEAGGNAEMILYRSLHLHPIIKRASESLFKSGHYADAIFCAYKALCNYVKERSEVEDLDGQSLMARVFDEEKPLLKLNPLRSRSDKDEQTGFKLLFMGAMTGIRNPKAHENVVQEDPNRTLEYLVFASLLAKRVDESSKKD